MDGRIRLESLLAHSPAVLYACRPSGDFGATFVSANVERLTGYGPAAFLGDPSFWSSRIHPDDAPRIFAELPSLLEKGTHSHEYRFLHADGRWRWMRDDLTLVRDASGGPLEIVGSWTDVTERHESEESLRESEELCRTVFDAASDGIILVDPATRRILRGNGTFARMVGKEAEGLAGLGIEALHPPDRLPEVLRGFEAHARGEATHDEDVPVLRSDGTVFPAEVDTAWIRLKGRSYMAGFFRDMTERNRAREEGARREREYRTLFDSTSDGIFILDLAGNFLDVNRAAHERLGYSREEMLALHIRQIDPPEDVSKVPGRLARISRPGGAVFEAVHVRKDGSRMPVEVNSRKIDFGGREVFFSVVRDLSERKAAEARLRVIFDASQAGIVLVDPGGTIVLANDRMAEMFRTPLPALVGSRYTDHVHPSERDAGGGLMRKIIDGELREVSTERRYLRADGTDFWGFLSGKRIENPDGSLDALVGVVADITERKRSEEERIELERRLLHAQKLESLGVLAGGIAHDFNNLLMAILGNLDLALSRLPEGSPARESIGHSAQAARRATDLTRQMLAYSGRGSFRVQPLDVNALVEENVHLFRASLDRSATLDVRLSPSLPWVEGDAGQLQQVIMNLLLNASEALGGAPGRVTLATGTEECDRRRLAGSRLAEVPPPGPFVYVEVADTGEGMDGSVQERLFDPFFTTKKSGRGLGMSAILGIVRGHRGAIFVDSAPGRGTAIRVAFPPCAAREEAPGPSRGERGAPLSLGGAVLVVDDEESVRSVCREMVEHLGCPTLVAADGHEAVSLFRDRADGIAVVLLDVSMPGMDGVATLGELLRIRPGARVVLSSGYDRRDAVRGYAGTGAAGFLQKPYTLENLRQALQEAARRDG